MDKAHVLNRLIVETEGKRYLEIGNADKKTYNRIQAIRKVHVDSTDESDDMPMNIFDVIFVDGKHDMEYVQRDIDYGLEHITGDGFIVCHDCLPISEVSQLPRNEFIEMRKKDKTISPSWMGSVWRVIVNLRNTRDDLNIFVLDCDCGITIITKGKPEISLNIDTLPTYGEFTENRSFYLNIKKAEYLYAFIMERRGQNVPKMYTEDPINDLAKCAVNRYYGATKTQTIKKGIILPFVKAATPENPMLLMFQGGICSENGDFVTGYDSKVIPKRTTRSATSAYSVDLEALEYNDDTVVFAGHVDIHFGHMLIDSMSRWWWFAHNPEYNGKIVLLMMGGRTLLPLYIQLLSVMGIGEDRVLLIDKPTRFKEVIVPDQTAFRLDGYKDYFIDIFDKIRDSVKPSKYGKVYLTRRQLEKKDSINEEYFETFFSNMGYKVIAPETLPLMEQITIISGAQEIACIEGTLSHLILFANSGVKLSILRRSVIFLNAQAFINQARNAEATYIDISMNFLPITHSMGAFLLAPTYSWREFVRDRFSIVLEDGAILDDYVVEYIKLWAIKHKNIRGFSLIKNKNPLDLLEAICRYFLNEKLDRKPYMKLYE